MSGNVYSSERPSGVYSLQSYTVALDRETPAEPTVGQDSISPNSRGKLLKCVAASLAALTLVGVGIKIFEKEGSASSEYAIGDNPEPIEGVIIPNSEVEVTSAVEPMTTTTILLPATTAPVESITSPTDLEDTEIVIIGDDECESDTEAALDLLEAEAPEHHELVVDNIAIIECAPDGDGSGMYAFEDDPRFVVGDATREAGVEWYAGSIVHDAVHAELYTQYKKENPGMRVPDDVWTGSEAEQTCLIVQLDVLEEIDASSKLIEHLKKAHDTKYWEIEVDDRDW